MRKSFHLLKLLGASTLMLTALTACGGGSSSGSDGSSTIGDDGEPTLPPVSSATTLQGTVSKGLITNGSVIAFDLSSPLPVFEGASIDDFITQDIATTNSDGEYEIVIESQEAAGLGSHIGILVVLIGSTLECDSAIGCGVDSGSNTVDFGEEFIIEPSVTTILGAVIPTPSAGTTQTVNINTFTSLQLSNLIGRAIIDNPSIDLGNLMINLDVAEVVPSQDLIASVFGLDSQDFSTVPFVDVTQPIDPGVDQQALRAAIVGAGLLTAGVDNALEQPFVFDGQASLDQILAPVFAEFLDPFAELDGSTGLVVRESGNDPFLTSLEEIFDGAELVAELQANQSTSAFIQLEDFLEEQSERIDAAAQGETILSNGDFPE